MRLALVLLLTAGCLRQDPLYCDGDHPCPSGRYCALPARECRSNQDGAAPDLLTMTSDLRGGGPADLRPAGCVRNYQCPASACDDGGGCHDPAAVIHVDDAPGCTATRDPYCTVQDALKDPGLGNGKDLILVAPSKKAGYTNNGDFIKIQKSLRLVGQRGGAADPAPLLLDPILLQDNPKDIAVSIEDLHVLTSRDRSGNVNGIYCHRNDPAHAIRFALRWSKVDQAPYWGVWTRNCISATIVGNQLLNNGNSGVVGGLLVDDGSDEIVVANNVVAGSGNGNLLSLGGVSFAAMPKKATVAFNTVADNHCGADLGDGGCGIRCLYPLAMSYTIATGDDAVQAACALTKSVVPKNYKDDPTNHKQAPDFADAARQDYHLKATDANRTLGVADGNPPLSYDLDGNPRPAAGGLVYPGAYQLVP